MRCMNDAEKIINPGARARRGVYERDVALKVAEKVAPLLEAQGAKVFMTRTHDNPWRYGYSSPADNHGRAILANIVQSRHLYPDSLRLEPGPAF